MSKNEARLGRVNEELMKSIKILLINFNNTINIIPLNNNDNLTLFLILLKLI